MIRNALVLFVIALLSSCGSVSTEPRPDSYYDTMGGTEREHSLFAGDASVLSDAAIGQILAYKYEPPALSRVALMPFGRELWSDWSEELSVATDQLKQDVIDRLKASPKVYDVSYLPSILIPEKRTVPHLREAAARYQADLLLVYRSYCRSFQKSRLFAADQSRAFCGVEAVLLDTRTGLVPFTSVASRSFDVARSDADMSFQETVLKAQLAAVTQALSNVSSQVVVFLGRSD